MAGAHHRATPRRRRLTAGGVAALGTAVVVGGAFAATSKTIVITDRPEDSAGPLDLTRISLQRAPDGRLRAAVSFAHKVTPKTLLATSGPPGSICVRLWTKAGADPAAVRPDRLACITARSGDEFRGGVYDVTEAALPKRMGNASVKAAESGRSIVVRFTQSSIGRPERIRFGAESTRPGCERVSCIDRLPDAAKTRAFRLR